MKIVMVSSEVVPFAKTGGLGDVLGALPKTLAKLGHEVTVLLPLYRSIDFSGYNLVANDWEEKVTIDSKNFNLKYSKIKEPKLPLEYIFLENDSLFDRKALYVDPETGADYNDNDDRFIFFNKAVLKFLISKDYAPDILHVHDWQAALVPVFTKLCFADHELFRNCKTVMTIHNLAFQGMYENSKFGKLGLEEELFYPTSPFEFYGKVNFIKASITYSDAVTTVSQQYAQEIQTNEFGCGLDGVLKQHADKLYGILNGVDYSIWSPSRDKKIPFKFIRANLSGKKMNKIELLNELGLPIREKTPLIGIISRLTDQKGFDLLEFIIDDVMKENLQIVLLGTGDEKYHRFFKDVESRYPDKCRSLLKFDDTLAHKIEAASDMFLMPSYYEPCGLNQMYSLKYGTVPIVRKVGGLADTVKDYNDQTKEGTGFVFENYTAQELLSTIKRAIETYQNRRNWLKIMKQGMNEDYSWKQSALKYVELYNKLR
ncbi:MAG: glycogen synthase GlgA [Calditrichaeota bacterium]|nr:MAG: glycogen synthase GlgA [Calditrichota bacterium]